MRDPPGDSAFLIVVFNDQRGAGSRLLLEHDTLFHALEILYCTVRPQSECHHRDSATKAKFVFAVDPLTAGRRDASCPTAASRATAFARSKDCRHWRSRFKGSSCVCASRA